MSSKAWSLLAFLAATSMASAALEQAVGPVAPYPELGETPVAPTSAAKGEGRGLAAAGLTTGYRVDVANREEVRSFYNTVYASSEGASSEWTGRYDGCDPGTTAAAFKEAVLRRINYFRAMAGIPAGVEMSDDFSAKAQKAALIMSSQTGLSHTPPPSWACYTAEGAEAAGNSNLALGTAGPESIDGYMQDHGAGNAPAGHRRWLLYPQTRTMGTGDVPGDGGKRPANATWVFDGNFGTTRPETREAFVAWPPPGYVPYAQVFTRWSFGHPDADFASASVTLSSNGVPLEVRLEPLETRVGEPTLVWYAVGTDPGVPGHLPKPASDIEYSVAVRGVRIGGVTKDFTYTVRAFDPAVPGPDHKVPVITGGAQVPVGAPTTYSFSTVPKVEGYEWREATREVGTVVEGAESGLSDFRTQTSAGYDVIVGFPVASGGSAFHLAHPSPATAQALVYERAFLGKAGSELRFKSRLGWASARQRASVQVSLDEGKTWTEIGGQAGTDGAGDSGFNTQTIGLAAYAGRTIHFRFVYQYAGSGLYYPQSTEGVGWYLDDVEFRELDRLGTVGSPRLTTGSSFAFEPPAAGAYLLQARALVFGGFPLDWGPAFTVSASGSEPLVLAWSGPPRITGNQVVLDFKVTGSPAPARYELWRADGGTWTWSNATGAQLQTIVPGREYRFTVDTGPESSGFYRVRGF